MNRRIEIIGWWALAAVAAALCLVWAASMYELRHLSLA